MANIQTIKGESVETTREAPKSSFTSQHRLRLSEAMKGRIPWNKGLTKKDPRVLKNTIATQSNPNLRKNLSKALMGHVSTFNRKHTDAEKKKISVAHTGKKKHYPVWNKGLTKKTSDKLRKIGKNISASLMMLPKEKRSEMGRFARMAMKPVRISRQEELITHALLSNGINVIPQHKITSNKFLTFVDLFFPETNTCVFIDGKYWHGLREIIARDKIADKKLISMSYKVKRFTLTRDNEDEIIKDILDGDIVRHSK